MKKILAALLVLVMLVGTVACSSDGVPDGYTLVSLEDEIFNLYVPKTWQNNSSSGMSSAYYAQGSGIIVSATSQKADTTEIALSDYVDAVIKSYEKVLVDYEQVTEPKDTKLDSCSASTFDYKAKNGDTVVKFRCIVAKNKNMFTTLTYCAPEADFENLLKDFEGIVDVFSFRDFEVVTEEPFIFFDEDTPEGFQLASRSKFEFRFYVPRTWIVNTSSSIPKAKVSATDFSNVSLNSFAVQDEITNGKEYWDFFKKTSLYEITELSTDENAKMGEYDAYAVEYITKISEIDYYVKQVFLTTSTMIYIFTYTSDSVHYDLHLDDVDAMLSVFEFKK